MKTVFFHLFPRNPRICRLSPMVGRVLFVFGFALLLAGRVAGQSLPPGTSGKVIKWDQPPALADPTNVFYGWNEESVFNLRVAADDWVCSTTNPVIKIRWWGSFIGWNDTNAVPVLPYDFRIHFWTDQPAGGAAGDFSHPLQTVWEIICTNFTWQCVGQDFDPRTGTFETCFLFEQTLTPKEWFYQDPLGGTNIYWLSIAADYPTGGFAYPFGWKTRQRDPTSPAPDAAVVISTPNNPTYPPVVSFVNGSPILLGTNQWDLAFELVTAGQPTTSQKWLQVPDLSPTGMDVDVSGAPQDPTSFIAADDFLCTSPSFITNIVIWGSWSNDILPVGPQGLPDATNVTFLVSIHDDIPATNSATGYSMPGTLRRLFTVGPDKFRHTVLASGIQEGWMTPPAGYIFPGDTVCHQYEIRFTQNDEPFFQDGSVTNPKVFWIDVQAVPLNTPGTPQTARFGWKTCITNWNDAAVWGNGFEPFAGAWTQLLDPPGHPTPGKPVDLAFRINSGNFSTELIKWSQPPVVATNPGNWFDGWNEPSVYGGGLSGNTLLTNIVADDWLCTNARPVSDIHWWGSFLDWQGSGLPPQPPVAFQFTIWTDQPQSPPNVTFSHPGRVLWTGQASLTDPNFHANWVGWDIDPRSPGAPVESCFKFDYALPQALWFFQQPGTNVYWLSIAAMYPAGPGGQVGPNPFGWKTRPHVPVPPDDAVRIFEPLAPNPGLSFINGEPIEYPAGTSWDMAYRLTSCQQYPLTNVVFTNVVVTNIVGAQVITVGWNAQAGSVYQLQEATDLNPSPIPWADVGLPVVGPTASLTFTNSYTNLHRFYRLCLPDICP